jgi:hypothetical protein
MECEERRRQKARENPISYPEAVFPRHETVSKDKAVCLFEVLKDLIGVPNPM